MMPVFALRSDHRDIAWPALPDEINARILALHFQYEQFERWPLKEIEAQQFRQIEALIAFCNTDVPFWRDRLRRAGIRPGQKLTPQLWSRLPVLTRRDAQELGTALRPAQSPADHGKLYTGATSGSTGMPMNYAKSELSRFFFVATNLRIALWHKFDMTKTLAASRLLASGQEVPNSVVAAPNWGEGYEGFITGAGRKFDIRLPPARQVEILRQEQASYLITLPGNAAQIARYCRDAGQSLPMLRAINTYGQVLSEDCRGLCRDVLGVDVVDVYSSEETGFLSMQCPEHDHHHVMAETMKLEIIDDAGHPCGPGQIGRVIITPLHNFAMPLLRYDIGDYARVGSPCSCGRTLPVLTRIMGRARDRVRLPNGEARLAFWGSQQLYRIPAIVQHQLAQISLDTMEYRLVVRGPLTAEDENLLKSMLHNSLGYPFKVRFAYVDDIPREASGKYRDFISEID